MHRVAFAAPTWICAGPFVVLMMAVGCGDDDLPGPEDGGLRDTSPDVDLPVADDARIEIGEGPSAFRALSDGDTVELVEGPQGGVHVELATRLIGMEPDGLIFHAAGHDEETGDALVIPLDRVLNEARVVREEDHWLRLGDRLIVESPDPSTVIGRILVIEVKGTPVGFGTTTATLRVRLANDT